MATTVVPTGDEPSAITAPKAPLPFTGIEVVAILVVALALIALGAALAASSSIRHRLRGLT